MMNTTYMPPVDHRGTFSKKRMRIQPELPIPVSYATAAIPTFAPYGTEYTPDQTVKIVAGRHVTVPDTMVNAPKRPADSFFRIFDPDLKPNKAIQHVHAIDSAQWPQQSKQRFDTTYRTEYINRIRHPNEVVRPARQSKNSLNNFFVLPPIPSKTNEYNEGGPIYNPRGDVQQPFKDQEVPSNEMMSRGVLPLNLYDQQRQGMMNNGDTYLPEEPVLLTDFEEQRLSEQIRNQLGNPTIIDRLKLFYQELAKYDPNVTNYVHYSNIQLVASQLGLNLEEDTLRFAMCKFVSPDRGRGYVNYEDMVRYFGKCLSDIHPNQYGSRQYQRGRFWSWHSRHHNFTPRGFQQNLSSNNNGSYNQSLTQQYPYPTGMRYDNNSLGNYDDNSSFDPDERQIRILLKQNLKNVEYNGSIDFDKLYNELRGADRSHSGLLNRQQIEEVVYKVRMPLQRSLTFQILEKHCRAQPGLYKWDAFIQYLQQQYYDSNGAPNRSSPVPMQNNQNRLQLLEQLRRGYKERDRLEIIEDYNMNNDVSRLDSNHPTAWFARFLRLANAMYSHRTSTNREQDFVLPREEARRHFRAYNHVWDLKIEEDKLQRVLDACARNATIGIDDALRLLAK